MHTRPSFSMTTKLLADLLKQSLWVKNSLLKTPLWSIVLSSNVQPNRDCGLRYTTPYILYYTYNAHENTFFDDDETAGRSVETISESRTCFVQELVWVRPRRLLRPKIYGVSSSISPIVAPAYKLPRAIHLENDKIVRVRRLK